ncbi:hypothetical protein ACC809_36295, partial [Rhizobium johnstonii]
DRVPQQLFGIGDRDVVFEFVWEVDVFTGEHRGLVIAEVEMTAETDDPALRTWLGGEVTGDFRYSNQALAKEYGHDRHGLSHSA